MSLLLGLNKSIWLTCLQIVHKKLFPFKCFNVHLLNGQKGIKVKKYMEAECLCCPCLVPPSRPVPVPWGMMATRCRVQICAQCHNTNSSILYDTVYIYFHKIHQLGTQNAERRWNLKCVVFALRKQNPDKQSLYCMDRGRSVSNLHP